MTVVAAHVHRAANPSWTDPTPADPSEGPGWIARLKTALVAAFRFLADNAVDVGILTSSAWLVYERRLREAVYLVGDTAAAALVAEVERASIRVVFGPMATDRYAVAYAERRAGELVAQISADTRIVINRLVTDAVRNGTSGRDLAHQLRQHIGLTEQQSRRLATYRAGLQAGDLSGEQIDRLTERFATQLLDQRCEMIARTETLRAANFGRLDAYRLAIETGALGPNATKVWLASPGACPECVDLDETTAPVDEPFGNGDDAPPAHPSCRCAIAINDVDETGADGGRTDVWTITTDDINQLARSR